MNPSDTYQIHTYKDLIRLKIMKVWLRQGGGPIPFPGQVRTVRTTSLTRRAHTSESPEPFLQQRRSAIKQASPDHVVALQPMSCLSHHRRNCSNHICGFVVCGLEMQRIRSTLRNYICCSLRAHGLSSLEVQHNESIYIYVCVCGCVFLHHFMVRLAVCTCF